MRMRGKDDCYFSIYTVWVFIRHAEAAQNLWQTSSPQVGSEYRLSSNSGPRRAFRSLETSPYRFHLTWHRLKSF